MSNLTSVTITAGVPTVGTGTVSTIDALMADGGQVTIGAKADAKSTATDTTAITAMQVWKQISASIQAAAASVAGTLTVAAHAVTNAGTFAVQPGPATSGGLLIARDIDLDEGTLTIVKASPGQVYGMWVTNTATTTRFIKFYDAVSGTAGTGTPVITIGIPGNTADDISGSFGPGGMGIAFATGICVGATTAVADADTGAPAANDLIVNVFYK